jgi:hypothetical protein
MASPYIVRPLAPERIAQAFPLVMALDPGLTLDRWSRYAASFVRSLEAPEPREILTAQNKQGYIHSLASCRMRRDLRHGRVLEVENFVSLDLTGNKLAAQALRPLRLRRLSGRAVPPWQGPFRPWALARPLMEA